MSNDLILKPIAARTISFLADDMSMEVLNTAYLVTYPDKLKPHAHTAMIGIGGLVNLMFLMSFEDSTIIDLAKRFVYGEITDEELNELKECVACEVANTVIGNSLVNLPNSGAGVTITPPVILDACQSVTKNQTSMIVSTDIMTSSGAIMLALIGQ